MKVLVVKMSSMGDVVHALPGLVDACRAQPDLIVDWVVEEAFQDIVQHHPAIRRVIPFGLRRWRGKPLAAFASGDVRSFLRNLREERYDRVIDAQGLLKSALVAAASHGPVTGFDQQSAREGIASRFYQHTCQVDTNQHAVLRQRALFSAALGHASDGDIDYGLSAVAKDGGAIMLFHGTSWPSKHWPEQYWQQLCATICAAGHAVQIPSGSAAEYERAQRIAAGSTAQVLPIMPLADVMAHIANSSGAIAVDTGLAHLAAAYGKPLVTLYGATDPTLTGTVGPLQRVEVSTHLACIPCKQRTCQYAQGEDSSTIYPPCYAPIHPELVWQALLQQIEIAGQRRG